jgi:hypothetical protein
MPIVPSLAGFASGVTTMYFLDPAAGKHRRHLARGKALGLMRRGPREATGAVRDGEAVVEGRLHDLRGERAAQRVAQPDDVTLARGVESIPGEPARTVEDARNAH